jgi:hypothetical protein
MASPQVAHSSSHAHQCDDDILWETTNANLQALQDIISTHFHKACRDRVPMQKGSYARVFLFTLADDQKVIAKVVFPVRETVKTEAEVSAMEFVRGSPFPFPYFDTSPDSPPSSPNPNTRPTSIPLLLHTTQSSTSRMDPHGISARPPLGGLHRDSHLPAKAPHQYRFSNSLIVSVQNHGLTMR